jgi:ABC-type nitrate/sulfonate/bicarbonate transport system permease component
MLAEWLATGQGMGYGMQQDANSFNYADIWASAARFSMRDTNA